jgi:type VI protein secretion system component Hcp
MSFDSDGFWDVDEQLRVLDLVQTGFAGSDMVMLVDNSGSPVQGESARRFPDGKARLDICGYSWGLVQRGGAVGAVGARTFSPLVVVRRVDAATASLASLVYARTASLTVCISAFRAGGDQTAADTQPMFELELADAQITGQFLTTGGPLATLSEILVLNYRRITLRSAAQQATGARSAVRECEMTAQSPA